MPSDEDLSREQPVPSDEKLRQDLLAMMAEMGTEFPISRTDADDPNTRANTDPTNPSQADDTSDLAESAADSGVHTIDFVPSEEETSPADSGAYTDNPTQSPADSGVYAVPYGRGTTEFVLMKGRVATCIQHNYGEVELDPVSDRTRLALMERYKLPVLFIASFRDDKMRKLSILARADIQLDGQFLTDNGFVRRKSQPYPGFVRYRGTKQITDRSLRQIAQALDDRLS